MAIDASSVRDLEDDWSYCLVASIFSKKYWGVKNGWEDCAEREI